MLNPTLVGDENITLVIYHDENHEKDQNGDNDYFNAPNTIKVDETKFTTPGPTNKQEASTLWLR